MKTNSGTVKAVEVNNEQAFMLDPMYRLMGIFEDSEAGLRAAEELKANGFDGNDIELFCGVKGAETYDFTGESHGLAAQFMRGFRNITFDRVIMERYQKALQDSHCVMAVHIHKTTRRDEAAQIMNRHGAVQVDHFGLGATKAFPADPDLAEDKYESGQSF